MDGFVRDVASRLPLAESVLRLFDFVCQDDFLSDVFRRHRGRSIRGRSFVSNDGEIDWRCFA